MTPEREHFPEPPDATALKSLSFTPAEYQRRLAAIQTLITDAGLDALLTHSVSTVCYFTGYESIYQPKYYAALIPATGAPILIVQDFEMHNALVTAWDVDKVPYGLRQDPVAVTQQLLHDRGLATARIGLEKKVRIFPDVFQRLQAGLSQVAWTPADNLIKSVRKIKSTEEIDRIRHAGQLADIGIDAALAVAQPGATDNQIAAAAYQAVIARGSEFMCLDPIITVGRRSSIPHTSHRRIPIQTGDVIFMEIGACVNRYTGVVMRTAVLGPPDPTVQRMADACARSVNALVENIAPGIPACDVAALAQKALGPEGQEFLWHGFYGYSIGLSFPPCWSDCDCAITDNSAEIIQPGMVFHCNTSLRDVGQYGTAFGDTVVVTETGCEVLTNGLRQLIVL